MKKAQWIGVALGFVALAACGSEPSPETSQPGAAPSYSPTTEPRPTVSYPPIAWPPDSPRDQRYVGFGLVIEKKNHEPELCLGAHTDTAPPQCTGTPLEEWTWDAVKGEDSLGGAKWGEYEVFGLFDGQTLTVVEAHPPPKFEESDEEDPFETPCPKPEDGWTEPDPAMSNADDMQKAIKQAEAQPDHSATWVDGQILNLAFTGDIESHEAAARKHWEGALCVSEFHYSYDELKAAQREVGASDNPYGLDVLFSDLDVVKNQAWVGVTVVSNETLAEIERDYGGSVLVQARLHPIDSD